MYNIIYYYISRSPEIPDSQFVEIYVYIYIYIYIDIPTHIHTYV